MLSNILDGIVRSLAVDRLQHQYQYRVDICTSMVLHPSSLSRLIRTQVQALQGIQSVAA